LQAVIKDESKNVVAVVTGGFQTYFYFGKVFGYGFDLLKKIVESREIVLDSERSK
jgi:hypothetical protein